METYAALKDGTMDSKGMPIAKFPNPLKTLDGGAQLTIYSVTYQ